MEDISFSIIEQPHINSKEKTILVAVNLQKKAERTEICSAPRARMHRKANTKSNPGAPASNTLCTRGKQIPERGQKVFKQLSTQLLINLGLCCRMGSWKAWQKSNAATGIEVSIKREGALDYEYSNRLTASPARTKEQRFVIHSMCSCTTPQQLFSDKPFSMHGNANTCKLAKEEFA